MIRLVVIPIQALLVLLLVLTPVAASAESGSQDCVHGNGKTATVNREMAKFDRLDVSGAFEIKVAAGRSRQSVRITGEENILPLIATDLKGTGLAIHPSKSICTNKPIIVEIGVTTMVALDSSGSDNVDITGLNAGKFTVNMSGSGDVELAGRATHLEAVLSGAGTLDAKDLKTEETSLNISGSGNANVYASEKLGVEIVGVGEVNYYGNPKKIDKQIIGVGNLNPM
jgi:hypothetical protein